MEIEAAIASLAALSQPTRLQAFRLLVQAEPAGLAAGELARALAVPQNTLSAHLAVLSHSSLVAATRKGRSIIYRANVAHARSLADFLMEDCCAGTGCAAATLPDLCTEATK